LAYSTVANLGLIVACAGIGSSEAIWAAIFLIIFHAAAKALLFMCVGSVEHRIGSRDIEDMDGLFEKMPKFAMLMVIGIAGMFLAPFGMLISKWAAMRAFVDSGNILIVMMLLFGSAATLFFWTKWLGKLAAVMNGQENVEQKVHKDEMFVLVTQAIITVGLCFVFPLISAFAIEPYLTTIYGTEMLPISQNNLLIMVIMMALVVLLPLSKLISRKGRKVPIYLAGVNMGDDKSFQGSLGVMKISHKNWYMQDYFGEKKIGRIGIAVTTSLLVIVFAIMSTQLF
jgi:ech hydrogenase subunit A